MSNKLDTIQQTNFKYIWSSNGTDAHEDAVIWRPKEVPGYHSLGDTSVPIDDREGLADSDDEDDYDDESQWMKDRKHAIARTIMVKDHPALVKPDKYQPVWKSDRSDDDVVVWKPLANNAVCYGHVGTRDARPPSTNEIRCIKKNMVTNMPYLTKGLRTWTSEDSDEKDAVSFWINKDTGTFFASQDYDRPPSDFDQIKEVASSNQQLRAASDDCSKMGIPPEKCSRNYVKRLQKRCGVLGIGKFECNENRIEQIETQCKKQGLYGKDCNAADINQKKLLKTQCSDYGLPNKFFPCTRSGIHQMEVTCLRQKIPLERCTGGILEYELNKKQQAAYLGLTKQQLLLYQKSEEAEQRSIQDLLEEAAKPKVSVQAAGEGHQIYVSGGGLLDESFFQRYKLFIFIGVATLIIVGIIWFI